MLKLMFRVITTITRFILDSFCRNVLRTGHKHIAGHHVREGALVSRISRSESFRRRYTGKHNFNIWKKCYGPGAINSAATA